MMNLQIKFQAPVELTAALNEICDMLGWECGGSDTPTVCIEQSDTSVLVEQNGQILLRWRKRNELFRLLSFLPEFLQNRITVKEQACFSTVCFMADMSRNAVLNLSSAKRMIRYLALMGYDSMMLYTEDTIELPEYPYFGYMRGRFTEAELRELDDYAWMFGIELIPCVQTLAHLATSLRWSAFRDLHDIDDILLVGDDRTYAFIDALLTQCRKCFRSARIHIGMDEAFHLGRGKYLEKNGFRTVSDIMCDHLARVAELCRKHGYSPMMWNDTFFHMAFNGSFYISQGDFPQEILDKLPPDITPVYWDYCLRRTETVAHMLDCQNQLSESTAVAGGAWKWSGFCTQNSYSMQTLRPLLRLSKEKQIPHAILTAWGDDGAEASQFSVLATLIYFAELCYRNGEELESAYLEQRAQCCCSVSFEALLAFDLPDQLPNAQPAGVHMPRNPSKYLLYNDPLEGFFDLHFDPATAPDAFRDHAERLEELSVLSSIGYALEPLAVLCRILAVKCDYGIRLRQAYREKDMPAMESLAGQAEWIAGEIGHLIEVLRTQWMRENKPYGFSTQEQRLGGLQSRMRSVAWRIRCYLSGGFEQIEELEQPLLTYDGQEKGKYLFANTWRQMVASGIL